MRGLVALGECIDYCIGLGMMTRRTLISAAVVATAIGVTLWWTRSSIPCAASLPYCTNNGLANGVVNSDPAQYGGLLMTQVVPNDTPSAY